MVKDFKYILKRIIIGVGIALVLMALKGTLLIGVHAQEISSFNWGAQTFNITTNTSSNEFNVTGEPWANWRYGYLYFSIGVNKTGGSSTDPILLIRNVIVFSGSTGYICNIGTTTVNNSTWDSSVYSVTCPMDLGAPGVSRVVIGYMPISTQTTSSYTVTVGGYATYEQASDVSVSVDTSSTNQAINNQITNDNTNTTNIINNQNQNTQQQIESQQVCTMYDKTSVIKTGYIINRNGVEETINNNTLGVTDFIPITSATIKQITGYTSSFAYSCFYNVNKTKISCFLHSSSLNDTDITIPSDASYFRTTIDITNNKPTFKICRNGNQAIADGQQAINDTLNDDSGVADNDIESLFQDLDISSDTPISDLLTMPITLVQAYMNGVGGTCQAVNLGSLYGTNLIIPCIDLESRLGSSLWNLIDVLFSLFMIYNIAMLIINIFDKVTSLDDTFSFFTKGGDM